MLHYILNNPPLQNSVSQKIATQDDQTRGQKQHFMILGEDRSLRILCDGTLVAHVDTIQELPDILVLHVAFLFTSKGNFDQQHNKCTNKSTRAKHTIIDKISCFTESMEKRVLDEPKNRR